MVAQAFLVLKSWRAVAGHKLSKIKLAALRLCVTQVFQKLPYENQGRMLRLERTLNVSVFL